MFPDYLTVAYVKPCIYDIACGRVALADIVANMDLRAILTEDNNSQRSASVQTPATPVTPVQQGLPQRGSREYGSIPNHQINTGFAPPDYPSATTPARQMSHPPQQYFGSSGSFSGAQIQAPYASPIQYQGQPQPPPLQVPTNADLRSPAGSYSAHSAQSPYRQTPTSSRSSTQYPFPTHNQTPQSPAQHHQYPPSFLPQQSQQQSFPVPQTPPIGIPGSTHPLLQHQRSHSSISTGTPTSAHSQPPYFNQPATPTAPPSERHSGSERDRSISVSPKTQPTKRKMDERADPPMEAGIRKLSKSHSNGEVHVYSKPRPKHYPKPPIWAQSVRDQPQRVGNPKVTNPAVQALAQLAPAAPIRQEPQTNGHSPKPANVLDDSAQSILGGSRPQQQMTKFVADWLFHLVVSRDDHGDLSRHGVEIEIEAKLGQVNEIDSNVRLQPQAATECVLRQHMRVGFKSAMAVWQHRNLNEFLNTQVKETHPRAPAAIRRDRPEVKHSRSKTVDKSYDIPHTSHHIIPPSLLPFARNSKLRISYDKVTNEVVATIIKGRIADLHICNPSHSLDCRISVSFEMKYDGDISQIVAARADNQQPDRDKDRHSYTLSHYQVDQTLARKVFNVRFLKAVK